MAIAFDAAKDLGLVNPGTAVSDTFTITGSSPILWLAGFGDLLSNDATGNRVAGATWNGVAMTEVARVVEDNGSAPAAQRWTYLFVLPNAATGTHTAAMNSDGTSIAMGAVVASYTGAATTGQPDNFTTNFGQASGITSSLTPSADNCWIVLGAKNSFGAATAGTGATLRVSSANGIGLFDSGGAIHPAALTSLTVNAGGSTPWGVVIASFSPAGGAAAEQPIEKRHGGVPFMSAQQLRGGVRGGVW